MTESDSDDFGEMKAFFASMANRPLVRVITPDAIAEQPDSELEVTIFDIVWGARGREPLQLLDELPDGFSVVYPTMALEAEVSNGGFNQFFYNPTRELYPLALAGYERLDCPEIVSLVASAKEMYGNEARMWKKAKLLIAGTLSAFFKSYEHTNLGSLDERMWAAKKTIEPKRIEFIRQNPELFTGDFQHLYGH